MTGGGLPTLAERVYESSTPEGAPWEAMLGMEALPAEAISDNRGDLAPPVDQIDLLQWGVRFGMAYALARIENPMGCEETWQAQAREAASKATRWHMTFGGKPEEES
jgi:hypothetical protein